MSELDEFKKFEYYERYYPREILEMLFWVGIGYFIIWLFF